MKLSIGNFFEIDITVKVCVVSMIVACLCVISLSIMKYNITSLPYQKYSQVTNVTVPIR